MSFRTNLVTDAIAMVERLLAYTVKAEGWSLQSVIRRDVILGLLELGGDGAVRDWLASTEGAFPTPDELLEVARNRLPFDD